MIPADNRILYFKRDRAGFGFLSHFYPSPIALGGEVWPTVEHYYQAQRSDDSAYRQAIRTADSPGKAKHLAASPDDRNRGAKRSWFRLHQMRPRSDWKEVKLGIMRRADEAKFTQHPDVATLLLATGDAELVEDSPYDPYWGIGADGKGSNWAGRVLMEIRTNLREGLPQNDFTTALTSGPESDRFPGMEPWRMADVEVLAFYIWEKNGRKDGHALEHWLEAEYLISTSSFVPEENRIEWARDEVRPSLVA
jgi:ribA/ribD-fused uncharacterized protein